MNSFQYTDLLNTLPKMPLAENMDVDTLLAYGEQLAQQTSSTPFLRSERAWNDLEISIASREYNLLNTAFDAFHEIGETPEASLDHSPFLDARLVLAAEPAFRQRLDPSPANRKSVNRMYRQFGSVIGSFLELDPTPSRTDKLAGLVALGALIRGKDANAFPLPASYREKSGRKPDSHDFYILQRLPVRDKIPFCVEGQGADHTLTAADVKTIPILSLIDQAVRSQGDSWVQAMAGGSGQIAREKRWLHYIGQQLVRESRTGISTLRPEAARVLKFLTASLHDLLGLRRSAEESAGSALRNTSMESQLKQKFNL